MDKPKTPNLVTILVLTTITVVFWIFFSVFRVLTIKPAASVSEEMLTPVNPSLDTQTLSKIEKRLYIDESQIPEKQYSTVSLTPTKSPEPTSAPLETTASPTPSASPSGEVLP